MIRRIRNALKDRTLYYVGLGAFLAVLTPKTISLWQGEGPRAAERGYLTHLEAIAKQLYDKDRFDERQTVEDHIKMLREDWGKGDMDAYKKAIWEYVQFWYAQKRSDAETGADMEPYIEIVKGAPGSCTEGSVIYWAHLRGIREDSQGNTYKHGLLLITYERTDGGNAAGHCLYLCERTDLEGKQWFSVGGINSCEDPTVEYESVRDAIRANTDSFRDTSWRELLEHRGVVVMPKKFCVIDPSELGIDLIFGEQRLNRPMKGKKADESYQRFCQRKMSEHFKENAVDYVENTLEENL